MKREVFLVGGPGDGKTAMVEHDQDALIYVTPTDVKWSLEVEPEPRVLSPVRTVYRPRRRGDYAWYVDREG